MGIGYHTSLNIHLSPEKVSADVGFYDVQQKHAPNTTVLAAMAKGIREVSLLIKPIKEDLSEMIDGRSRVRFDNDQHMYDVLEKLSVTPQRSAGLSRF